MTSFPTAFALGRAQLFPNAKYGDRFSVAEPAVIGRARNKKARHEPALCRKPDLDGMRAESELSRPACPNATQGQRQPP
jgi:hypothetical protein